MNQAPIWVIKKDNTREGFNMGKVIKAVNKSARRSILRKFNDEETKILKDNVTKLVEEMNTTMVSYEEMHAIIETTLDKINPDVCRAYKDYRNWRDNHMAWDELYQKAIKIRYRGDKENSNSDSSLVSTKSSLIYHQYNKELYQKYFMTKEELEDCRIGYYYIHDMGSRLDTMNCCLFDISNVLSGGFEMGNMWYSEPKSLDVAFDVIGDIVLSAASQQYGGFTLPEIDTVLEKYARKSFNTYKEKYINDFRSLITSLGSYSPAMTESEIRFLIDEMADNKAFEQVKRDFEQGFQGWEYRFNTVASSRGDYPFITITTGLNVSRFGILANECLFEVRKNGQGKKGFEHIVPFPKIVFLFDERLHGPGKEYEFLFDASIRCSQKAMYPDYLSLTGEGYIASMYKKYKKVISPMG